MMPRRRLHRAVFVLAAVYNVAWGVAGAVAPQWMFRLAGMEPLNHPDIFRCLAMVIGLYGLLYLEVARSPESGWPIAAVGLAGKLLGPAGMVAGIVRHAFPPAAFLTLVGNDLVWWVPFGLYLHDAWPAWRGTWRRA
jgi:hypothetical protein